MRKFTNVPPFILHLRLRTHKTDVLTQPLSPSWLLEELELAQQRLHALLGAGLQGQAGGDVLRLLDPKLVGHAGLRQSLSQTRECCLVRSLGQHTTVWDVTFPFDLFTWLAGSSPFSVRKLTSAKTTERSFSGRTVHTTQISHLQSQQSSSCTWFFTLLFK